MFLCFHHICYVIYDIQPLVEKDPHTRTDYFRRFFFETHVDLLTLHCVTCKKVRLVCLDGLKLCFEGIVSPEIASESREQN